MTHAISFKDGRDEVLVAGDRPLPVALGTDYETVAASQTTQVMGATGAIGDMLSGVQIIPTAPSPGAVTVKDGSGGAITIFAGGVTSVQNLQPFYVSLGIKSVNGAWMITTGANVTAIGIGNFS